MDKDNVLKTIMLFKDALEEQRVKIKLLILYGSYAKGNADEMSDIDIVVVSDDFKEKGFWERIDILTEAIYKVYKPIEAVAITLEEWEKSNSAILRFAREGGEVVYEAA